MESYVDIEVRIVNIYSMGSLLEVDVSNAVGANIVVLDKPESGIGSYALQEGSSCLDISVTLNSKPHV